MQVYLLTTVFDCEILYQICKTVQKFVKLWLRFESFHLTNFLCEILCTFSSPLNLTRFFPQILQVQTLMKLAVKNGK